jgi:hypothetical protein
MPGRETKQQHKKENRENKENKENKEKAAREVTAAERTAIEKYLARTAAKQPIRYKVVNNGSDITLNHPDPLVGRALLMNALGSADSDFVDGIVSQFIRESRTDQGTDERKLNFLLSIVEGIEPKDQLETMLAAQMAVVHVATMTMGFRLTHSENILEQDSTERPFNKLARTFAMQMEALKRYRTGAEQKVTLQNVSVADGGQAIVGNVTQVPREKGEEQAAAPPRAPTDSNVVPMPVMGKNQQHDPLSVRRKSNK